MPEKHNLILKNHQICYPSDKSQLRSQIDLIS